MATFAESLGAWPTVCLRCQGLGQVRSRSRRDAKTPRLAPGNGAAGAWDRAGAGLSRLDPRHPLQLGLRAPCPGCAGCGLVAGLVESLEGSDAADEQGAVVVAGGGIGGLALALALQQRGMPCIVLERDLHHDARQQVGAALCRAEYCSSRLFVNIRFSPASVLDAAAKLLTPYCRRAD